MMDQDLSDTPMYRREAELRGRIWRRASAQRFSEISNTQAGNAPNGAVWSVLLAITVIPYILFRIKLTGRIPGVGREYRWFRRQRYLAPEIPGTFLGFAERLTMKEWPQEMHEQVAKFLTNAALEDLRVAYGRLPWRLRGARRMTYAVVLLNNVTRANGGYALLKLINDVRNETGYFDPLLIVSTSGKVPPHAIEATVEDIRDGVYDANEAEEGYFAWRKKLASDRRKRNEMTWYLPISTQTVPRDDKERSAIRRSLNHTMDYRVDPPPWWSRRIVPLGLSLCLIASAGTGTYLYNDEHCGVGSAQLPLLGSNQIRIDKRQGENPVCIGVTDGSHLDVFVGDYGQNEKDSWKDETKQLGDIIVAQNREAERLSGDQRPLVTMAYLGDLFGKSLAAQHETLAGIAIAQRDQNLEADRADRDPKKAENSTVPVVRVLVANGGPGMKYGKEVADNHLRKVLEADPTFIGVVGLNHSRQNTINTIKKLTEVGLPMVASTLSLTGIYRNSPMYYQVSPQNSDQARKAAEFAAGQGYDRRVWIYRDKNDLYSKDLASHIEQKFGQERTESLPNDAREAGIQACSAGPNDLVYYAGRGDNFDTFIEGVVTKCGDHIPADLPTILAGDDVTQHVADVGSRKETSGVPYYYQSFAVAPNKADPDEFFDVPLSTTEYKFYCDLNILLREAQGTSRKDDTCPPRPGKDLSLDGHAALAHDAARVLLKAVVSLVDLQDGKGKNAEEISILKPGYVWRQLKEVHSGGANQALVTGTISFSDKATNYQVPANKGILTLKVDKSGNPQSKNYTD